MDARKMTEEAPRPDLFPGGGALRAVYRSHDWNASAIGHPDSWPVALRNAVGLMLDSQFPMFIAWGAEHALLYNTPYTELLDFRHPQALGAPARQVWPELWEQVKPLIEKALAGEPSYGEDVRRTLLRHGHAQDSAFTLSYSPVRNDGGEIEGAFCVINETTGRLRLERSQGFQLQLADRLRGLATPQETTAAACELIGAFMAAGRVGYGELSASGEVATVEHDWTDGKLASLTGQRFSLADFGNALADTLANGDPVVLHEVNGDSLSDACLQAFRAIGVGAVVIIPLSEHGRLTSMLYVHDGGARNWLADEVALIKDVAERVWSAAERTRAQQRLARVNRALADQLKQLAKAESQQAFQLHVADVLRELSDVQQIFASSCELLGRFLGASRVLCGNYDFEKQLVTYHANYTDSTVAAIDGTYAAAGFGADNFAPLESGATWVCDDLAHAPRTAGPETWPTFEALQIRSAVVVPHNRHEALIACLFINDSRPRHWSEDEVRLIEDVAGRMWNAVERVRAEEALLQADRRKDQFLAMLAHELRNPLAPISAAAELLKLPGLDQDRLNSTGTIIARQVSHMTGLVDDLLDVSRVNSGLVVIGMEEVDIKRVVADAVEQVRPLIEARRHRCAVHIDPGSAHVMGDYKRLVQVLANLANNAAKYTPEGGNIEVRMETSDEHVVLRVCDDGVGMSHELLPHVFELFSQAERSSDRTQGGLGLGLALVKSLVELHGGSVAAHSKGHHAGSQFTVRLPRMSTHADSAGADDARACLPATDGALRLMVVDDNVDGAQMLAMFLEASGHQVAVEHSSHSALARAQHEPFDAFLLDIGLPGMDGNELAQRLRALPLASSALLVAITGYGQQGDDDAAARAGFDHYFVKPVDPARVVSLLALLQQGLRIPA